MKEFIKKHPFEIFLLCLILIPHVVLACHNPNTVLDWYTSDDAFYYFQAAKNIAAGDGSTFDGITLTNGYHPLWMLILIPVFWFARFSHLLPLRILMVLLGLLNVGSGIFLYNMGNRFFNGKIAALVSLLWALTPAIHTITTKGGVESGLSVFFIFLFWDKLTALNRSNKQEDGNLRQVVMVGLIAVLVILSRLDNVFLVFFGGTWFWLSWWQPTHLADPTPKRKWLWRLQTGLAFFLPVFIIMLVYMGYNHLVFGTSSPVSGQIKRWWGTLDNTLYGFPIRRIQTFFGQFFTSDEDLGPWSALTAPLYLYAEQIATTLGHEGSLQWRRLILMTGGGIGAILSTITLFFDRKQAFKKLWNLGLIPLFLACFVQICYYKLGHSLAQQPWYWMMERIFLILIGGVLLDSLYSLALQVFREKNNFSKLVPSLAVAASVLVCVNFLAYMQLSSRSNPDVSGHYYFDRPRWLDETVESGSVIAITGAGNLGYFSTDQVIVNLDGLMNSNDYFQHLQAGTGADYLSQIGVDFIFGNEYMILETNPYTSMLDGHLQEVTRYHFEERELILWKFTP
ncbi:MAG: hypothetical protein JXA19_02235 [Anaerolineales bacterium]|nr:hypothetical protein [Anaerolineales bacterium]